MNVCCKRRLNEGNRNYETGVIETNELQCGYLELNLGTQKEQPMILAIEPSFYPFSLLLNTYIIRCQNIWEYFRSKTNFTESVQKMLNSVKNSHKTEFYKITFSFSCWTGTIGYLVRKTVNIICYINEGWKKKI